MMTNFSTILWRLLLFAGCSAQSFNGDFASCSEMIVDPPECPEAEYDQPIYFPYPYDCTQYFECFNGTATCLKCAPETIWDQENLICNHISLVNCTWPRPTPVPTTTPNAEDPINWVCPEGYEGLIGHPNDTCRYYFCDPDRRPCLIECAEGYCFNPETFSCELAAIPSEQEASKTGAKHNDTYWNYKNLKRSNADKSIQHFQKHFLKSKTGNKFYDPCEIIKKLIV